MCVTYTTPSVVMYSLENITANGVHNQTHQMFSLSVVFREKKKVRILCVGCQGGWELSNHMSSVSSRMHLLSLGYRYRKGPADYSCKCKLNLTCSEDLEHQKAPPCTTKTCRLRNKQCRSLISVRLWCQHRHTVILVTHWWFMSSTVTPVSVNLPFLRHKSFPGRSIQLRQTFSAIFGGWSCRVR